MIYIVLGILTFNLFIFSEKLNELFFNNSQDKIITVFIFSSFYCIIYLISSYLFLLKIETYYISYILVLLLIIPIFSFRKKLYFYINKIKKTNLLEKTILTILLFYFFMSLLPASDEDALRYHLEIGKKINNGSFFNNTWLDYITIGAEEFLNSFALQFKFENISGYTNFIFLFFTLVCNVVIFKKYKIGSGFISIVILLSSPYLFQLLSSQKFYFLPCFIVTYSFVYLYLEKKIENSVLYLIFLLNIFCFVLKATFLPFLIIIFFLIINLFNNWREKLFFVSFGVCLLFIFYFPIYYVKLKIYNDPFIPFFSINPLNEVWLNDYYKYLKGWNMDATDLIKLKSLDDGVLNLNEGIKYYSAIFAKLFFPLRLTDIFKTIGIGLFFIFFLNYKKHKKLIYLVIFFIISVIVLQNYQTRWFFPLFLLVCIFAEINKFKILKNLTLLAFFSISLVTFTIGSFSMLTNIGIISKDKSKGMILDSYKITKYLNKEHKGEKVFSNLNHFYHFDNVVPVYYPHHVAKFKPNYYSKEEEENNLILWFDDRYDGIFLFVNHHLKCKKYKLLKEFNYNSRRFKWNDFFKKQKNNIPVRLYRLEC